MATFRSWLLICRYGFAATFKSGLRFVMISVAGRMSASLNFK